MGNSVIFSGTKVKALKDTLSLNDGADIISSATDPTSVAVDAKKGTLLLNTSSGNVYKKNDDGSTTNWSLIASASELSDYLKKDGSVAMTGDLDLGNNDIVNAASVSSSGSMTVTAPGNLTLQSTNGGGNNVVINALDGGSHLSAFDTQIDVCRYLDLTAGGTYGGSPVTGTLTLTGQNESNIVVTTDNTANDAVKIQATAGKVTLKGKSSSQLTVGGASAATIDAHSATIINVADPTNAQDVASKAYVDLQVGSASASFTVTAGETLSAGDMVYICNGSDGGRTSGRAYKLDATNDARVEFAGVVSVGANSGDPATIQVAGEIAVSGLTVGEPAYGSVTVPGGIQTSAPTTNGQWVIQVGVAKTTGLLIINGAGSATANKVTAGMPDLNSGQIYVGNASNTAAAVSPSGDVTIDNAGVTAISSGVIVNADVNASAAIARSKIASGSVYRILVNNSSGVMSENAALTATRLVASDSNGQLSSLSSGVNGQNLIADSTQAGGYRFKDNAIKNYILNSDAEVDAQGWVTYLDNDSVTFQDTGDTVTLNAHGMSDGQTVSFTSISSSNGLTANNLYYVVSATTNTFQVASSFGGSAIAITANTNGTMVRGRPVDGTAGTAVTLWERKTSSPSPIRGSGSFTWTKGASNKMGEGVGYAFTIDAASQSRVLQISFDYKITTATTTYADGDMSVWIYDVTNATLIQPAPYKILNFESGVGRWVGTFQTASNSTSYRLILHTSSVSTTAYTLQTDNFSIGEQVISNGAPVTDWVSYTPLGTATNTTYTAQWRRVGDTAEIRFKHTMIGTPASFSSFEFSLPPGLSADTTKASATGYQALIGFASVEDNGVRTYDDFTVDLGGSTYPIRIASESVSGTTLTRGAVSNSSPFSFAINDLLYGYCKVPISGWSSNVVMSADAGDNRVVDFVGTKGATQAVTGGTTDITFTASKDSHGTWSGSAYTIAVPGDYQASTMVADNSTTSWALGIYVNGTLLRYLSAQSGGLRCPGATILSNLKAGDTVSLRVSGNTTLAAEGSFCLARISGPVAVAASETVAASFWCSANKSSSTTAPIDFDSKEFDTHGSVTTGSSWKYTANTSGTFSVGVLAISSTSTWIQIYKNGSAYKNLAFIVGNSSPGTGTLLIKLLAGEYIDLRCVTSATVTGGTLATTSTASVSIVRVGNY